MSPTHTENGFFVERDSLELKLLQDFLAKESPSCEVVLACDPDQAAVLALRRRGKAKVILIQGGLADGRADRLLDRLTAGREARFSWVAFADRRHCRGGLDEPSLESLQPRLRPLLAEGWLLVRFLEPRAKPAD